MGELEQSMSLSEYYEWQNYLTYEPLACDRAEVQMSILLSMLANFMSKKEYKAQEFMLSGANNEVKTQDKK